MANPSDKGPDSSNSLPNAELNPLLNPTLGQHLDRWAEVYFTNPPEKREQAVLELLRELQASHPAAPTTDTSNSPNVTADPEAYRAVWCPSCRQMNLASQKFCGMCGSSLAQPDVQSDPQPVAPETPATPVPEFSEDFRAENDWQWLRDRNLARLNDPQPPAERGLWKYGVVGLALLLAGFGYLEWASRTTPSVIRTAAPVAPAPTSQPQPQTATAPELPAPQPELSESAQKPPVVEPAVAARENANQPPVETSLASPLPTADSTAAADGSQELLLAQHYLEGTTGSRDAAEAAKWLWKAVGKQNPSALVMLADLYLQGDGVPKSCDQARLLLVAAAKKGAPDAGEKLRHLELNGCP